jgi:AcrR family transcriptional regulator
MARTPKVVEDRREQILDAALRVFAQKGFTRATNKDIAREAGITAGLIYHYFASKEDVLRAILESRSPVSALRTLPPEVYELPTEQFLRHLMLRVLGIVENEPFVQLIRVVLPEVIYNPKLFRVEAGVMGFIVDFLQNFFQQQMDAGRLRQCDALQVAQVYLSTMMGFVLRRQIFRDPVALSYTQEQVVDAVLEIFLPGLLPR